MSDSKEGRWYLANTEEIEEGKNFQAKKGDITGCDSPCQVNVKLTARVSSEDRGTICVNIAIAAVDTLLRVARLTGWWHGLQNEGCMFAYRGSCRILHVPSGSISQAPQSPVSIGASLVISQCLYWNRALGSSGAELMLLFSSELT